MQQKYDNIGRWYLSPTGEWYPSITTILKILSEDAIKAWRERIGEAEADRISAEACARGIGMHDTLEAYCRGLDYDVSHPLAQKIIPILDGCLTEKLLIESYLCSHKLRTAGRCDLIGTWNGIPAVIDFKTASKPKCESWIESYFLQACFYCVSAWQQHRIPVRTVVIIVVGDWGVPQVFVNDARQYYPALVSVRNQFEQKMLSRNYIEAA